MPTNKFEKGNTAASGKKGKKHRRTIVKEVLGVQNIEDLKPEVLEVWKKLIQASNTKDQAYAAKEISKYIFPQKREHSGELNQNITVNFKY